MTAEDKSAIIAELQKHTGGTDKGDTVKNFLTTLADYNRLALLKGVCEKFGELMSAARGEVELTVISASVSRLEAEYFVTIVHDADRICSNWTARHFPDLSQRLPSHSMLAKERS